ncbi:hypothetical protein BHECKSOX_1205 [Bathymodiolus heckerae thiotrophic gill symbiont]|uniref:hypothetical protein n=1 Tax=Bathymodiolus heckerae thiotrophic gill symbiont TaxID=1052212 RepID=UPI0010B77E91|nr:hypothetical protein [Bathymodiolus heckerae thiotrophic gill symbiont]SHN89154.1 hypothetical protein BHECKSOX_1205 [Bathymodiolus heckerae thiotrophic gill symbiont]
MYNDDANLLLALHIDPSDYKTIEIEVKKSLILRGYVWDELLQMYETKSWR